MSKLPRGARWAVAALLIFAGQVADAQDFVIRNARVCAIPEQGCVDDTDVWVRSGKIATVGVSGSRINVPVGTEEIPAQGLMLTPGLFAGLSRIGLEEVAAEPTTVDSTLQTQAPAWNQQWRPEFDVTLAFNPSSTLVPVARIEGLTWTVLMPGAGDSIIQGQGAAVTLGGQFDAVLEESRSLFIQLGSEGSARSGDSRAGQYMLLDQAVQETRTPGPPAAGSLLHERGRAVLAKYLAGGRVIFDVDRAADILRAVAWARSNGVKPVIAGGSEAWLVAEELARAKVPVIMNPLQDLPGSFDRLASRLESAALLQRAGVLVAFSSGESHNARTIRQLAGNAVAHGLGWDEALAAITTNPALIFGQGRRKGSIEKGQDADLVLWTGDPLELSTFAQKVWIAGRSMPMHSRQTELRDRYLRTVRPP